MCGAMESMHHSCYKEYSGHLIDLRENINTMDLGEVLCKIETLRGLFAIFRSQSDSKIQI